MVQNFFGTAKQDKIGDLVISYTTVFDDCSAEQKLLLPNLWCRRFTQLDFEHKHSGEFFGNVSENH